MHSGCMAKHFPFSIVPSKLEWIAGDYDYETNSYHQRGDEGEVGYWFDVLTQHLGPLLAPGMINMYVPVSRTAVHRRIKSGGLTTFYFHSKPATEGLFAGKKEPRESPFVFVPAKECRYWSEEIKAKKLRLKQVELSDIEDQEPAWHQAFWVENGSAEYGDYWDEQLKQEERFLKHIYKGLKPDPSEMVREYLEKQERGENADGE